MAFNIDTSLSIYIYCLFLYQSLNSTYGSIFINRLFPKHWIRTCLGALLSYFSAYEGRIVQVLETTLVLALSSHESLRNCFIPSHIPNQATRDPTGVSEHSYKITIVKAASLPVVPQVPLFVLVPGDLLADLGQSFFLKAQHK